MPPPPDQRTELQARFHRAIPGGSHTYAKGDDQFPEFPPIYIARGSGCHVWDTAGNEYIEYAMGLRSVTLGHAFPRVVDAVARHLHFGSNFNRPSPIELECAETLLQLIPGAEMAKFAKNGSDANGGAVKLARAYTGRDLIAVCVDQPFFSVEDWFIGTTAMDGGIPETAKALTLKFRYNDLESVDALFREHPGRIAALMLEPEKDVPPAEGFLRGLLDRCHRAGALLIFDEMITGFRWHNGGAQAYYGVTPDLSTFGKALGNGFSVSALVGRRDIMRLGGLDHDQPRVFLLSTTHGAEVHALAAALEVMRTYRSEPVVRRLWEQGQKLAEGITEAIDGLKLHGYFSISGKPCCLGYATMDAERRRSQAYRTLFLQETLRRGVLAPSLVVSYSHSDEDVQRTVGAVRGALEVYRRALDEGIDRHLAGRPVKPVMRKFN